MSRNQIQGKTSAEIASSVEKSMHAGGLAGGSRLPTIRDLAATLRVSPVTVAAAYRILQSRGLIAGGGRRGTHVRAHTHSPGPVAPGSSIVEGAVDLASGNPDPALLPQFGPYLKAMSPGQRLYGDPLQCRPLVAFAGAELEADGIDASHVTVTSGALDAVERVLRAHLRPGDHVLVEDPALPALLDLLRSLALTPHGCAVDDEGPDPDSFDRALGSRVRAAIFSPRAQNPTGAALTPARAADLSRALRRHTAALIVEIDSAGPVSGAPAITLIDRSRPHWAVVRSTSKFLGPDLRVAVMAADALTSGRVQRQQALGVRWVSHVLQLLTLALWSDPSSGRRLARAAEVYRQRRTALIEALASQEIAAQGASGLNVWVPVREETATVSALASRGWSVAAGERFRLKSAPAIRVTTSALEPDAARRLAADLAEILRPSAATFA